MFPGGCTTAGNGGRITLNEAWALLEKIEGVRIPAEVRTAEGGRRAGFSGGHDARAPGSGARSAVHVRAGNARDVELVSGEFDISLKSRLKRRLQP